VINERVATTEASIKDFITQKACYVRNKAIAPLVWVEQEAIAKKEELEASAALIAAKLILDGAETTLQNLNEQLSKIQSELSLLEKIQSKVLSAIEGDVRYDASLFIDCGGTSLVESLTDVSVGVSVTSEGVTGSITTPTVPDVNIPVPTVVNQTVAAARQVGGISGTIDRIEETQEEIEESL
jgi:hypothetical protein